MDPEQNQGFNPPGVVPPPPVPPAPLPKSEGPKEHRFHFNLPIFLTIVMLLATIAMAVVAIIYINKYNEAKADVDGQKAHAAEIARQEQIAIDQKDFEEKEKLPFRTYQAPAVLGAIQFEFPKNWNVYAIEQEKSTTQLDVFMYPGVVRSPESTTEPYAFRVKLETRLYPEVLQTPQGRVKNGKLKAQAVTVSGITGTRFDGLITDNRTGSLILLPVRDKTLSVWTESNDYLNDYNQILTKLTISP